MNWEKNLESLKNDDEWTEVESNAVIVVSYVEKLTSHKKLYIVIPFISKLLINYRPENKLSGVKCVEILLEKFTVDELIENGYLPMILHNLRNQLAGIESKIGEKMIPLILKILNILEPQASPKSEGLEKLVDDTFLAILTGIELTRDQQLQSIYFDSLRTSRFLGNLKYTKKLLQICLNCLDSEWVDLDGENLTADVLLILIEKTSFLATTYMAQVLLTLFKLKSKMKNLQVVSTQLSDQLERKIAICCQIFENADPTLFNELYDEIVKVDPECWRFSDTVNMEKND